MKKLYLNILLLPLLLSINLRIDPVAEELCVPDLVEVPESSIIGYDPFLPGSAVQQFTFELANPNSTECRFDIALLSPTGDPALLIDVNDTNVVFEIRPVANGDTLAVTATPGVYRAIIPANESKHFNFEALVVQDAVASAEDHIVPIQFQLRQPDTIAPLGQSWFTNLILRSVPRAQLNISGASGSFGDGASMSVIDFGIAETGKTRRVFVQIRANTLAQLTIDSENNGQLIHKENPEKALPIPYSARLDASEINLETMYIQDFDIPRTYSGQSLPFELTLGDISGAMAGDYEDTLTIEFSPL